MKLSDRVKTLIGFTLQGTNTFIVGTGPKKILIDTGQGIPRYIQELTQILEGIQCIILTHKHKDHVGGLQDVLKVYGDVPVYKYSSETDLCEYLTLFEGQKFETGDSTLVVLETPGHSDDHICLYLEEEQAIFTGDIILGTGSTVLENYTQYLSSMDKLLSLNAQFLYPAHGEPKVSANKISEDLNHRKQREDQIMGVLEGEMTTKEIAAKVYGNIGEELYKAAENNAKLYLQHLKSLGSVSEINDKWAKHRT